MAITSSPTISGRLHSITMKKISLRFFMACALCLLTAVACVRQHHAESAELTTFHAGDLKLPDNPDAPKTVYVDASASPGMAASLARHLGTALASGDFRIAATPSKAGYILHVKILREGQVAPDSLKAAVNAGYGGKSAFRGQGAQALLADALMVQRRVPSAKRPSRQRLKNITSRNALGSSQMRVAVMATGKTGAARTEDLSRAMANELAMQMKKGK